MNIKLLWNFVVILLISSVVVIACTGPEGPQGPAGPAGPAGPEGPEASNESATQPSFEVWAVDQSSTIPKKVKDLPQVGYIRSISSEGILSMFPTKILTSIKI